MEYTEGILGMLAMLAVIAAVVGGLLLTVYLKRKDPSIDFRRNRYFDEVHQKGKKGTARVLSIKKQRNLISKFLPSNIREYHTSNEETDLENFFSDEEDAPEEISVACQMKVEVSPQHESPYVLDDGCPGHKKYSGWWVFRALDTDVVKLHESAMTGQSSLPVIIHPTDARHVFFKFEVDYWLKQKG